MGRSGAAALCAVALSSAACGGSDAKPRAPQAVRAAPGKKPARAPAAAGLLPSQVLAHLDDESASTWFASRGRDGVVVYAAGGRWLARATGASAAPFEVGTAPAEAGLAALRPVGDGYLFAWLEAVDRSAAVRVVALDAAGRPRGAPVVVAPSADEIAWLDVLPNDKGALVLWEARRDDRADLVVVPVSAQGKPGGQPASVVRDALGWEVTPTAAGAAFAVVVANDEEPAGKKAAGKKTQAKGGAPQEGGKPAAKEGAKAAGKDGKQSKAFGKEEAGKGRGGGAPSGGGRPAKQEEPKEVIAEVARLGRVVFIAVGADGAAGAAVPVTSEATAQIDVDVVWVGGRFVIAWTDGRDIDTAVYLAVLDGAGKLVTPPQRATAPAGEQALVTLVASPGGGASGSAKRALLLWEDLLRAPGEERLIHLAPVSAAGSLEAARASLVFAASGPPDVVVDGDGFAALTLAPAAGGAGGGGAGESPVWPAYVRFGPNLEVLASRPVRAEPFAQTDGVPYLTRALSCSAGTCTALASGVGPRAPLALVSLPAKPQASGFRAPAWREDPDARPRATAATAVFDGDHLADVAAAQMPSGGMLAAWVTYYLDGASSGAADGKKQGALATLGVRAIDKSGVPGATTLLSKKAVSLGGVALAAAPPRKRPGGGDAAADEKGESAALAWVARDKKDPQVFVTKLDAEGKKTAQKALSVVNRRPRDGVANEPSDVAIAYAGGESGGGDGWVVAWSDTREGNAEIYAARVDRSLVKVVPDRRITSAPGDSAEVEIVVRGKDVLLAWGDARQSAEDGLGDIWVARLDATTLEKRGDETRIFASAGHSRSPALAATEDGYALAWIEEGEGAGAAAGAAEGESGVRFARLDDKGAPLGVPQLLRGEGGAAITSVALGCAAKCRGVLTSVAGESLLLTGFERKPGGGNAVMRTLAMLSGGVAEDVSPVFASPEATSLFFADDATGGTGRVRWMTIAWP